MPVITFSKKDFESLVGRKLSINDLKDLLDYAKAELEVQEGDNISVKYNDTNQPYLWCPEGLAILFKGLLGKETGIPKLALSSSGGQIVVDRSVKKVRPFIAGFVAKGPPLSDYLIKLLIQLQEKLADSFGRHRDNIAIGVYPADKINFSVAYKTVKPDSLKFLPLDAERELSLAQILEQHPKGKEYSWILAKEKEYPILVDAKNQVLSFPPIINSQTTGRLSVGDKNIFFEATGKSSSGVDLCAVIVAYALSMRGYTIHPVTVKDEKTKTTPLLALEQWKLNKVLIQKRLGLELSEKEIGNHLTRFRYEYDGKNVKIPPYRQDIMHEYDIIEDIGIAYGYNNITPLKIHTHTRGAALPEIQMINSLRDLCVGLGCQEVFSQILSDPNLMWDKMGLKKQSMIEIENFTSATYSCVRTLILPILLSMLSQNRQAEAPYKVFEEGLVTLREGTDYHDEHHLAIVSSHATANFTEIRQIVEYLLDRLGISYTIKPEEHSSFISGRCAAAFVGNKKVAFFGEIHPAVLQNFNIDLPTVGMEMNLSLILA